MTLVDLRIEYKRNTGDTDTPISNEDYDKMDYTRWLEEQLIKHVQTKKRFIPWETLDPNNSPIH